MSISQKLKNTSQILYFYARIAFADHIWAFQKIWRETEDEIQCYIDEIGGKFLVYLGYKIKFTLFLIVLALLKYFSLLYMTLDVQVRLVNDI